jgi:hypothetical protein
MLVGIVPKNRCKSLGAVILSGEDDRTCHRIKFRQSNPFLDFSQVPNQHIPVPPPASTMSLDSPKNIPEYALP